MCTGQEAYEDAKMNALIQLFKKSPLRRGDLLEGSSPAHVARILKILVESGAASSEGEGLYSITEDGKNALIVLLADRAPGQKTS